MRDEPITMRILQEPDEWVHFWEHFPPVGPGFPCNNEPDCPGCTSTNEKTKKPSKKVGFNMLHSFNGQEYVDAFKIGPMVADKLENRFKRLGTITDRDYTLTRYKTKQDRYDFDVEAGQVAPVDLHKAEWKDIESMLADAWNDVWGDTPQAQARAQVVQSAPEETPAAPAPRRPVIAPTTTPVAQDEPPFEGAEIEYKEADLRAMSHGALLALIKSSMQLEPPASLITTNSVVDWLMEISS
jgi:hypothetical protein